MNKLYRDTVTLYHADAAAQTVVRTVLRGAYHYSNECDMINRLVLGMSAKQVRELYGIDKSQSIRPYLSSGQMYLIDRLQKIDAGLLISTPDYQSRKRQLEWYLGKIGSGVDHE